MRTLRTRLLIGTGAGATIVLLAAGILLYTLVRGALWREFDESLAAKARSLAAMAEQENGKLELEFDDANLPEFRPSDHAEFYQVRLPGARTVARSASLEGRDLVEMEGPADQPVFTSSILPDGRRVRTATIRFTPRQEDSGGRSKKPLVVTLVLGRQTKVIEATLGRIRFVMAAVGVAAIVISLGVLAWSVRRGLRPVNRLANQIAAVGESDLGVRIEPAGVPAELLPVIDRLNGLLGRLERAFQRERRFTADVAHELRTPLAGVRSVLEVTLSKQREPEAYQKAMQDCLGINEQMQRMVENLLHLARADANQLEVGSESVDLAALARECWEPLAGDAQRRQLQVVWRLKEPCIVESDRGKLRLVLQNILGNAVAYADDGGRIWIENIFDDGRVEFTIANTGSAVPEQDVTRVFDRFWRGDASRRCSGQHCGLGLSLCKVLVELLGGSIEAFSSPGETFKVAVRLQAAGDSA
ncbi:MAG: sensor histidine kinase N-terminal domain-containing protein [Sedimentisphaerales bacterium]|nr:sensor histidine kinase N-terminal domain-containing protein [Sedimentisphaerales bacterium]